MKIRVKAKNFVKHLFGKSRFNFILRFSAKSKIQLKPNQNNKEIIPTHFSTIRGCTHLRQEDDLALPSANCNFVKVHDVSLTSSVKVSLKGTTVLVRV